MKKKTQIKWISYVLLIAMVNLQVVPVWAGNETASSKNEEESDSESNPENDRGDPVNTKTGDNHFNEDDFSFNTPGVSFRLSREYNSIKSNDGPIGPGWSHSLDWRLHEAREIICTVVPSVTNENFKVNLWEGHQLLADGQDDTGETLQTNVLSIVSTFLFGAPTEEPVDAYVEQPGGNYFIDLDEDAVYGNIGGTHPIPVSSLEDMNGNILPLNEVTYATNTWLEVYEASGSSTRFWDYDEDGVWLASDNNLKITSENGQWILHSPGGMQRIFNEEGRMLRHQDGWGKGWGFAYTSGNLVSAIHDNGLAVNFTYTSGHLSGITAGAELGLVYTYLNGQLETVTRTVGTGAATKIHTRSYVYEDGILIQKTNPANHVYHFSYEEDAEGALTHKAISSHVDEGDTTGITERWLDQSLVYRSETLTDFTSHSRGLNLLERMAFSSKSGKLTDSFGPGIGNIDAETRGIHYEHNSADDISEEKIFDGSQYFSTHTTYDTRHNPATVSVAYNTATPTLLSTTTWNPTWMLPSSTTDAEGNEINMTYQNGSLKTLSKPGNAMEYYNYTGGMLTSFQSSSAHSTYYTYDSRGYLRTIRPNYRPDVFMVHDAYGYPQSLEVLDITGMHTGRITSYDYNALGWLEKVTHADSLTTMYEYNGLGYRTKTIDRAGRITDYAYAPTKKLTSVKRYLDPAGANTPVEISYDYDQWFNTVTITEPMGRSVESYQLDVQDRVEQATNVEGQTMDITYFVGDFVDTITRFDNSTINNTYDNAGRKSTTTYSQGLFI